MLFNLYIPIFFEVSPFENLEAKTVGIVLFSPKGIPSLLSTNQSHMLQKSLFNGFSILLISLF